MLNTEIFEECAQINTLIENSKKAEARSMVINLLDKLQRDGNEYTPLINHLIREVGLFPYIDPKTALWEDQVVVEAFKANVGDKDPVTLHSAQSHVLKRLLRRCFSADAAKEAGLPFAPGIMTPSEIEQSLEHGCTLMKFFPAGTTGGGFGGDCCGVVGCDGTPDFGDRSDGGSSPPTSIERGELILGSGATSGSSRVRLVTEGSKTSVGSLSNTDGVALSLSKSFMPTLPNAFMPLRSTLPKIALPESLSTNGSSR